ncbi:hypothetical protein MUP07_04370 [Candidatus Bathyarchaeota archaeon]|nr:hypothetical protein [Candidatus Bathyarchaeota archaeon]
MQPSQAPLDPNGIYAKKAKRKKHQGSNDTLGGFKSRAINCHISDCGIIRAIAL